MKRLLLLAALAGTIVITTGCESIVTGTERTGQDVSAEMGGAGYDYHRVEETRPDGTQRVETRVRSTSQRDITSGVVTIDGETGSFDAEVEKTTGNEQAAEITGKVIDAATGLINKIPGQ